MTDYNQRPSEIMKIVESGEVVQITRRGEPVARLVPEPRSGAAIERLVAAGLLVPARSPRRLPTGPARASVDEVRAALAEVDGDLSSR